MAIGETDFEKLTERIKAFLVSKWGKTFDADTIEALTTMALDVVRMDKYSQAPSLEDLVRIGIRAAFNFANGRYKRAEFQAERMKVDLSKQDLRSLSLNPEEELLAKERIARWLKAINRLEPKCRYLILLLLLGESTDEIQKKLGFGATTVHMNTFRCRERLRKLMPKELRKEGR